MSKFKYFAVLLILEGMLACSKHSDPTLPHRKQDPALQTALDELQRLHSFTEAGLNYSEYSDRLLTAKGNIDVALQRTTDEAAKHRIGVALSCYVNAREAWRLKIENHLAGSYVQDAWTMAARYSNLAREYAFADEVTRQQLDAREKEQVQAEKERFESERQAKAKAEAELEARREQAVEQERKAQDARWEKALKESQAKEAEEKQKRLAEEKQNLLAQEARRERLQRFAPEGTVFNLKQIPVQLRYGVTIIAPGTELKVIKKNADGSLHIQRGELAADVPSSSVTNDRDLAASLRTSGTTK